MKKLLLLLILFFSSVTMYAEGKKVLSVLMKDGTSVYFLLEEQPRVTFVDDAVKIVSKTNETTIKRSFVNKFEFVDEIPTSVNEVEKEVAADRFELTGNSICIEGLAPGCAARLYSIRGEMLVSAVADDNGSLTLSFESLPSGVYVVNYNETTIKFMKR